MTKPPNITDVHVDAPPYNTSYDKARTAAGFTFQDARYHIWFNVGTRTSESALYKNPLVKCGEPGFYEPRKLDADKPGNKRLLDEMWRQIEAGDLVAKAIARAQEKEAARRAEAAAEARLDRIKEAGPTLLNTLQIVRAFLTAEGHKIEPPPHSIVRAIDDAIAEAERAAS